MFLSKKSSDMESSVEVNSVENEVSATIYDKSNNETSKITIDNDMFIIDSEKPIGFFDVIVKQCQSQANIIATETDLKSIINDKGFYSNYINEPHTLESITSFEKPFGSNAIEIYSRALSGALQTFIVKFDCKLESPVTFTGKVDSSPKESPLFFAQSTTDETKFYNI